MKIITTGMSFLFSDNVMLRNFTIPHTIVGLDMVGADSVVAKTI